MSDYPKKLYREDGSYLLALNTDDDALYSSQGWLLTTPPKTRTKDEIKPDIPENRSMRDTPTSHEGTTRTEANPRDPLHPVPPEKPVPPVPPHVEPITPKIPRVPSEPVPPVRDPRTGRP